MSPHCYSGDSVEALYGQPVQSHKWTNPFWKSGTLFAGRPKRSRPEDEQLVTQAEHGHPRIWVPYFFQDPRYTPAHHPEHFLPSPKTQARQQNRKFPALDESGCDSVWQAWRGPAGRYGTMVMPHEPLPRVHRRHTVSKWHPSCHRRSSRPTSQALCP